MPDGRPALRSLISNDVSGTYVFGAAQSTQRNGFDPVRIAEDLTRSEADRIWSKLAIVSRHTVTRLLGVHLSHLPVDSRTEPNLVASAAVQTGLQSDRSGIGTTPSGGRTAFQACRRSLCPSAALSFARLDSGGTTTLPKTSLPAQHPAHLQNAGCQLYVAMQELHQAILSRNL